MWLHMPVGDAVDGPKGVHIDCNGIFIKGGIETEQHGILKEIYAQCKTTGGAENVSKYVN